MGIKFTCPACGAALNVKSELAGKRGRCPKCQAKITIPEGGDSDQAPAGGVESQLIPETTTAPQVAAAFPNAPTSAPARAGSLVSAEEQAAVSPAAKTSGQPIVSVAPGGADPIAEAPTMQWYAVPPGAASQYGPASGEEFRAWLQEGRITADSLVWRQDWADWKRAGDVFPQLEAPVATGAGAIAPVAVAAMGAAAVPLPTAVAAMPMVAGGPPVAQAALPVAGTAPGPFPAVTAAGEGFPIATEEPASTRAAPRGRQYRQRSNTGPVIAIVVLLVAMIPLSYFVWKVISDQLGSAPATETATGSNDGKE